MFGLTKPWLLSQWPNKSIQTAFLKGVTLRMTSTYLSFKCKVVLKFEYQMSLWSWKKKWRHLCFKNVILISGLQNYKNQIVQYSQILICGALRAATIDTTRLANVHFIKEAEQELRRSSKKVCSSNRWFKGLKWFCPEDDEESISENIKHQVKLKYCCIAGYV